MKVRTERFPIREMARQDRLPQLPKLERETGGQRKFPKTTWMMTSANKLFRGFGI
jgi:hypothetical protein